MPSENTKRIAEVADRQREQAREVHEEADRTFAERFTKDYGALAEARADRFERRVQHTENLAAMAELLNRLETLTDRLDRTTEAITDAADRLRTPRT